MGMEQTGRRNGARRPGREKEKKADTAAPHAKNNTKHSGVSLTRSLTSRTARSAAQHSALCNTVCVHEPHWSNKVVPGRKALPLLPRRSSRYIQNNEGHVVFRNLDFSPGPSLRHRGVQAPTAAPGRVRGERVGEPRASSCSIRFSVVDGSKTSVISMNCRRPTQTLVTCGHTASTAQHLFRIPLHTSSDAPDLFRTSSDRKSKSEVLSKVVVSCVVGLVWFVVMRDAYHLALLLNRSFLRFADARGVRRDRARRQHGALIERIARSGDWRRRFSLEVAGKRKCEASSEDSSALSSHQMSVRDKFGGVLRASPA